MLSNNQQVTFPHLVIESWLRGGTVFILHQINDFSLYFFLFVSEIKTEIMKTIQNYEMFSLQLRMCSVTILHCNPLCFYSHAYFSSLSFVML